MEEDRLELRKRLLELQALHARAVENHKNSGGSVRRELERVMNEVAAEIQELERKIKDSQRPG